MRFLFAQVEPTATPTTHNFSTQPRLPAPQVASKHSTWLCSYPHDHKVGVARTQVCRMERWRHVFLLHVAAVLTASLQAALLLLSLIMICLAYTQLKRMHTHTRTHIAAQAAAGNAPATRNSVYCLPPTPLVGVFMENVTIKTRFNFAMANDKQPEQHANTLDTHKHTHTPPYTGRHTHVARYCHNMAYKHANIKQQPQRHRHRQWDKVMLRGEWRHAARRVRP